MPTGMKEFLGKAAKRLGMEMRPVKKVSHQEEIAGSYNRIEIPHDMIGQ